MPTLLLGRRFPVFLAGMITFVWLGSCQFPGNSTQELTSGETLLPEPSQVIIADPIMPPTASETPDFSDYWIHIYPSFGDMDLSYLVSTSDGGVLIGNDSDILLRLDKKGKILWGKQIRNLYPSSAFELQNGTLVIIGTARITYMDPEGNVQKTIYYSHLPDSPRIPAPPFSKIDNIQETAEGNIIAAGINGEILTFDSQGLLISLKFPETYHIFGTIKWIGEDASWKGGWSKQPREANWIERNGTDGLSWRRKIVAGENEYVAFKPHFVLGTQDSGALFGSYKRDYEKADEPKLWLIRFDKFGDLEWEYTYDVGPGEVNAFETQDGGFVVAGWGGYYFHDSESDFDGHLWISRISPSGNIQWSKIYGNGRSIPLITKIEESSDGAYYLSGNLGIFDGEEIRPQPHMVLMKIGAGGEFSECDLLQPWPLPAPEVSGNKIVDLYSESYQILETEIQSKILPHPPIPKDLDFDLIQACVSIQAEPTPVPPPAYGRAWIIGGNGIVLGSFSENSWIPADAVEFIT